MNTIDFNDIIKIHYHNVSSDAVHKSYAVADDDKASDRFIRFDKSKNHFHTDLSINKCNAPLNIGFISENVMCDNTFVTDVNFALHLSGADNCIVSNSRFEQTKAQTSTETTGFIYAEDACNCWVQNSYVRYIGEHRATTTQLQTSYVENMFANKAYRRMFIGEGFKISNHCFKFTGCEFHSSKQNQYYFSAAYDISNTVFHEYWDNCISVFSEDSLSDFSRLKCINSLSAGITIRNSYLKNTNSGSASPFRFHCGTGNCNCTAEDACPKKQLGKRFPFVHYENNILDNFLYANASTGWNYHINTYHGEDHNFTISEAVDISGSYVSNVYRLNNGKFSKMSNLM